MRQRTIQILSITLFLSLLFWGIYTFLVYIGVPVHSIPLLKESTLEVLLEKCRPDGLFCRGAHSLFPLIGSVFKKFAPFSIYIIGSILLYSAFLVWNMMRTGSFAMRWTFRPWHIVLLFVVSLWLVFNSLSYKLNGSELHQLVEPTREAYNVVDAEGMQVLQENFNRMKDGGCLTHTGRYHANAGIYRISHLCFQKSFFTRVLGPLVFIFFLLAEFLILGRLFLQLLRVRTKKLLTEAMLSAGIGACGFVTLLWLLAVISVYVPITLLTAPVGWLLLIVVPLACYRQTLYWAKKFLSATWSIDKPWYSLSILVGWLLLSYLTLNYLNVIRPFPIGWDDLGSYLNRPRLMVSYGHFIFSMAAFQWEYITSLGYLLFGYASDVGAVISMEINWMSGLLATLLVFTFVNTYLGRGYGLLSALLYYALPMVGHFSFADMKIDNAVFLMGSLSVFCVFLYLFPPENLEEETEPKRSMSFIIAAGIFGGFAFAMKPTAIMVLMALGAVLMGVLLHWVAFIGIVVLAVCTFAYRGVLDLGKIAERIGGEGAVFPADIFIIVLLLVGIGLLIVAAVLRKDKVVSSLKIMILFGIAFLAAIAPWIAHNNVLSGDPFPPRLLLGAQNTISPRMDYNPEADQNDPDTRTLPPELALDPGHPNCKSTGSVEELDRYWGYRVGWKHYLTLPWRMVMNLDSAGYYVTTTPLILLVPLLLLLPFFWMRRSRWLRWFMLTTLFMFVEWMFLANGVPWYGVGMFFGLMVGVEVLVMKSPDKPNRIVMSTLVALSLLVMFGLRMWQLDVQKNLLEYPFGKSTSAVMVERTIPYYNNISDTVVARYKSMPERPYLYRIGTFIPYFIPRNLEVIGSADHQLDTFNCLYQERDPALTVRRLKALGFQSIIFDTNTATIERDPNGSLHKKVGTLVDFLNSPASGLSIVVSDSGAGVAFVLIPDNAGEQ